jgi:hypothetical protein
MFHFMVWVAVGNPPIPTRWNMAISRMVWFAAVTDFHAAERGCMKLVNLVSLSGNRQPVELNTTHDTHMYTKNSHILRQNIITIEPFKHPPIMYRSNLCERFHTRGPHTLYPGHLQRVICIAPVSNLNVVHVLDLLP